MARSCHGWLSTDSADTVGVMLFGSAWYAGLRMACSNQPRYGDSAMVLVEVDLVMEAGSTFS